ncbi:S8 family serine peptidase [Lacimicrobium alkaliphilum]|uniref:Protease n=1 Tax=Lacimicrobium alkaliphilum TaxID=1526571 RepID=A0ABQ1QYV4_9ALTE|nr:S8 family serine peptidase [Lacimicrobium alkaliphilum]GGD52181.1 protease [Lacimicrobium alkaliphilum]
MNFPRTLLVTALSTTFLLTAPVVGRESKVPLPAGPGKFVKEPGLKNGIYNYIVRLHSPAVAGMASQLTQANSEVETQKQAAHRRLDIHAPAAKRHAASLRQQQQDLRNTIDSQITAAKMVADFQYALNAVVLRLTPKQAARVARLPQVAFVERSEKLSVATDSSPAWTGADQVWEGQNILPAYQGEGVIVGILDTGINTDHPSFAEVADDGYQHQNPLGGYLGDCQTSPGLCNNKLIGVYSYQRITSQYDEFAPGTPENGEDHNGHGSHVAGAAAGNVLFNVPLLDVDGQPMPAFTFERIAGIAPRANLISYQVCEPGEEDDIGFAGCWTDLVIEAIEQAIIDGVDVLNHSIGASSVSPWQGSKGQAFLNAREAGIIIANSAGNSGPDPESASIDTAAPWVLTVAAYTHDRVFGTKTLGDFTGGDSDAPGIIEGEGKTTGISAKIVYAGDFSNPNDPGGDPAQCIEPFPAGTFSKEIVVCDRGQIARVDKGKHVQAGGAGGMVLANVQGDAENLVADNHVIPAIHIDAISADRLRNWLASGTGHRATISVSEIGSDPELANIAADFSSRGPNNQLDDVITPSLAAPGVEIWSAYADDQPEGFKQFPDPADYAFLNGTSMAAPHVAGAAALLKGMHPDWSAAQIQSALMLSANPVTFKEDGLTPSDPFDMGSGMLNVSAAAESGLIMDISIAQYQVANPDAGGDPKTLNMPSMADSACFGTCSWSRIVEGTQTDSWSAQIISDSAQLTFSVSPNSFSINQGEQQQLEIVANSSNAEQGTWQFASLQLSSASGQLLTMPVAIKPTLTTLPETLVIEARRDADSVLINNVQSLTIDELTVRSYGLSVAQTTQGTITEDSNNEDVFDDLSDGVESFSFTVPANAKRFVVELTQSQAPDLDLWVGRDENNDGMAQEEELIELSANSSAIEKVDLTLPDPGEYWVLVQSWQGSGSPSDAFTLNHAIVDGSEADSLMISGPESVEQQQVFSLQVAWDQPMSDNDRVYGAADLGTTPDLAGNLGLLLVDMIRLEDDVTLVPLSAQRVFPGEEVDYKINVAANPGPQSRAYVINATIPENVEVKTQSISGDFTLTESGIRWQLNKVAGSDNRSSLNFTVQVDEEHSGGPIDINLSSQLPQRENTREEQHQPTQRVEVEGPPEVLINNQTEATVSATSGDLVTLMATASDPNQDPLTISWQQTSGSAVTFQQTVLQPAIRMPVVSSSTVLGFQITVTDTAGLSSQASVSVTVNPEPAQNSSGSGGGSLFVSLGALLLLTLRRTHTAGRA